MDLSHAEHMLMVLEHKQESKDAPVTLQIPAAISTPLMNSLI